MLKVSVKGIPVFYAGKRHLKEEKLTIEDDHFHEDLFELIETIEDDLFKGKNQKRDYQKIEHY